METHVDKLRNEGLVTARESILMKSKDGTVIEVFEWISKEAMENAHRNETVLNMWDKYSKVCDYIPITKLKESSMLFVEFKPF